MQNNYLSPNGTGHWVGILKSGSFKIQFQKWGLPKLSQYYYRIIFGKYKFILKFLIDSF